MHFLLDGDGVLWRAGELLPGVKDFLALLKEKGIGYSFISNNSSKRRSTLLKSFRALGLPFSERDIFNSNYLAGWYIEKKHKDELILVIGHPELAEEIASRGVNVVTADDLLDREIQKFAGLTVAHYLPEKLKCNPSVVLIGIDTGINYARLALACRLVQDGSLLIATNRDYAFPAEFGYFLPGSGAQVEVIEKVCGKKAITLGKPEPFLLKLIEEEKGISRAEMVIIGDRLDTDILMAVRHGIRSVLVLTGVTSANEAQKAGLAHHPNPTFVVEDLVELTKKFNELFG